ncbi:hypothetical protein CM49_03020 [Paenibacillus sp. P1XP2]|nr:hypothetical protein CM49_03020 [Paenibacillus sp. P1XP2]
MKREGTKVTHLLEIVKNMEPVDERLYTGNRNAGGVKQYLSEAGWLQEEWGEIAAEGERLLEAPTPELTYALFQVYAKTGSRREYEQAYFERRRRLNTFALLSLRSPEKYLDPLLDILWAICDEYSWCVPAHLPDRLADNEIDLFAAETGFALAEISVLLRPQLPPLMSDRIRSEVKRRVLTPFLAHGPYAWETATHNWSAVCAGSVGAAALLLEEDARRLADILARTEQSMEHYLSGFGEDGACLEGIGYWRYGFGYFVYYSDLLLTRSKGRLDWFRREKVAQIAAFQQKCFLCGDQVVNFSDSHPRNHVHLGLSHKLAERFPGVTPPPARLRARIRKTIAAAGRRRCAICYGRGTGSARTIGRAEAAICLMRSGSWQGIAAAKAFLVLRPKAAATTSRITITISGILCWLRGTWPFYAIWAPGNTAKGILARRDMSMMAMGRRGIRSRSLTAAIKRRARKERRLCWRRRQTRSRTG